MSATGTAKGIINDATRELHARWDQVREHWRDAKAAEFSQTYLSGLAEDTSRALRVIDELERLIARIHDDCE
ncbi:hypothetical protein [Haloferula sp. A504]|jgi:hypothetical protein|uniref:hypothetical protein n=1 Tax=Haloferula sp. A504 TaxID=3373601 RepID=UPI0031CAE7F3|nr:hypothetical protein [Verrucomicrobiaceae bacterium E54]